MKFQDFINQGTVRKAQPDIELIKSLIKTADSDLIYLKSTQINENSSRKIISDYYDVLRSLLEAMTSSEGYKVYSHEAFTYFLKEKNQEELSFKFDRFRKIRNKINYYGKMLSLEEAKEYVEELSELITQLKTKIKT